VVQSGVNNTEPSRLSADEFAVAVERISTLIELSQVLCLFWMPP